MICEDALQQLLARHPVSGIMWTRCHTSRLGRGSLALSIAQIAGDSLGARDSVCLPWVLRILHFDLPLLVRHHENVAVGTVGGAKTAPDAMILDDDLQVLAAMDGIDGAAEHAVRIR